MVLTRSDRDVHTFHSTHPLREKPRGKRQDKTLTPTLECFLPLPPPSSYYPSSSSSSSFAFLTTTPFGSSYKEDDEHFPFPPAPRLVRQDAYLGLAADTDKELEEEEEDEEEEMNVRGAPRGLFVHTNQFVLDDATAAATAAVLEAVRSLSCSNWNDVLLISPLSMSGSSSSSSSFFPPSRPPIPTAAATSTRPGPFVPSRPSSSAASSSSYVSSASTHTLAPTAVPAPSLPASTTSN